MGGMPRSDASNLLILVSDEHRRDAMGCAGHAIVKTPNLDALARRGSLFENAYTPSPMCVPTRAAIACGDYVHAIQFWDSATPFDGSRISWMRELRDAGVDVVSIGKLHFRSSEDDNGFSEEILPMHVVDGVGWPIGLLRKDPQPYDSAAELAGQIGAGTSSYTEYDLAITQAAERWLGDDRRKQKQWAAFVSLVSPHYPLTAPEQFYHMYDPLEMDLPVGYDPADRPDHAELKNVAGFFDYDRHFDEAKIRQAKCAYYGLTSFMDDCVGRILKALEDSGQMDNTVVVYVSDHGDMMGDLGFWTKQVMYEASVGVPMIAAGPGLPQNHRVRTGASLMDLATTAFDVAGVRSEPGLRSYQGKSLREIARTPDDPDRIVFSEYHDGGSTTGTFMVRWDHWKYVQYVGYAPQLFDLSADVNELSDLVQKDVNDPTVKAALEEGEKRLRRICDPEAVNALCFADQARRIQALGGVEACKNAFAFNHTPTPAEWASMRRSDGDP